MNTEDRPLYFYLFAEGKNIKIERMTDSEALDCRRKGRHFIDIACKTIEEAEAKRNEYISIQKLQSN